MSQGFPKQARLLNSSEYSQVLRRADKKLVDGPVQIKAKRNNTSGARLGLVVPKKGTAKAHDRNRIKRVIREQFRLSREGMPPVDLVVLVFGKLPARQLSQTLHRQFENISSLYEHGVMS